MLFECDQVCLFFKEKKDKFVQLAIYENSTAAAHFVNDKMSRTDILLLCCTNSSKRSIRNFVAGTCYSVEATKFHRSWYVYLCRVDAQNPIFRSAVCFSKINFGTHSTQSARFVAIVLFIFLRGSVLLKITFHTTIFQREYNRK